GNFSTKLLRADPTGISRLHGQVEERTLGPRAIRLYPLYHPAAALYTPATLDALRADFHRIPEMLALGALAQPEPSEPVPEAIPEPEIASSERSASPSSQSRSSLPEPESAPEPEAGSASEPEAGSASERIGPPPPAQLGLF
ncbi:MAG: hypothetical protein WCB67_14275, partial [Solirubrobacteraceae bacterium]